MRPFEIDDCETPPKRNKFCIISYLFFLCPLALLRPWFSDTLLCQTRPGGEGVSAIGFGSGPRERASEPSGPEAGVQTSGTLWVSGSGAGMGSGMGWDDKRVGWEREQEAGGGGENKRPQSLLTLLALPCFFLGCSLFLSVPRPVFDDLFSNDF